MSRVVAGPSPAKVIGASIALFYIAAAAILQGGCASDGNTSYATAPTVAAYVQHVPSAEVEDDGLPSQAPPPARIRQMPDDPSQPYSPNYGGPNPASSAPERVLSRGPVQLTQPSIPADLPPDFRRRLVAALAAAE
jgi:hypothetical protein